MSKLLTVFGATGAQGGALVKYVLEHPSLSDQFRLRGITRDSSKPAALALEAKGVEVIEANLNNPSSLVKAVSGSHCVFGITNFWEQASETVEIAQGKAIADACVAAGVTQLIWSSLPNVTLMTNGEITSAKHFDSKAKVEQYIRSLGIKSMIFMPGWFMTNNLWLLRPKRDSTGGYVWSSELDLDTQLPLFDIRDIGKYITPALLQPDVYNGKSFTCATRFYTAKEIMETWTKVTGKELRLTGDASAADPLPIEMRTELKIMKGLFSRYGYFGPTGQADLEWTLGQLSEKPNSWETFVIDHEPWFED